MTMRVNVYNKRKNEVVDQDVRERLEAVVGKFADRIAHIEVHIIDENGDKGGDDKICTIDVKLNPRGQLHVRAKHNSLQSAINKAVERAETVVAKAVDKGHRGHEVRHQQGREHYADHDHEVEQSAGSGH